MRRWRAKRANKKLLEALNDQKQVRDLTFFLAAQNLGVDD